MYKMHTFGSGSSTTNLDAEKESMYKITILIKVVIKGEKLFTSI